MKFPLLIPLILIMAMLAGCISSECRNSTTNFGVRFTNEGNQDLVMYVHFPQAPESERGLERRMPANGGGVQVAGFDCKGNLDAIPDPMWMRIELREPGDDDFTVPQEKLGPLVFEGNWTGMACGGTYVFQYYSSSHVEAFEVDSFGGCGNNPERKMRNLERVPP